MTRDQLTPRSVITHKAFGEKKTKTHYFPLNCGLHRKIMYFHFSHRQLMDLEEFINKRYQHILQQSLATLHFNTLCQQFYLTFLHFCLLSLSMMSFTDTSISIISATDSSNRLKQQNMNRNIT